MREWTNGQFMFFKSEYSADEGGGVKSIAPENKFFQQITNLPVHYICKHICMYSQYFHHGNFENSFRYDCSIVFKIQRLAKIYSVPHLSNSEIHGNIKLA